MMTPHAGQDRGFFFQPEIGDEVMVMFEDGDVERPVIIGASWSGVNLAPTEDFWGGEYQPNEIKRIVTKAGHRIALVDKPGKESISLATPQHLKIGLFETANETGRPTIQVSNDNGDIILSAPNGRIHLDSKLFSREVGDAALGTQAAPAPPLPAAAPPPAAPSQAPRILSVSPVASGCQGAWDRVKSEVQKIDSMSDVRQRNRAHQRFLRAAVSCRPRPEMGRSRGVRLQTGWLRHGRARRECREI